MARTPLLLRRAAAALILLALLPAAAAASGGSADVAALQVALRALHQYSGGIDGVAGPGTKRGVQGFQRSHHLHADGVVGPETRRAMGRRGSPLLGSRLMREGYRGWDVAALQFLLKRRGYLAGSVDGGYGADTTAAVQRFQRAAGITADGRVGHATINALRSNTQARTTSGSPAPSGASGPVRFLRPLNVPLGDGFGYPGGRRHDGVDFPAPTGTPIGAAGVGVVTFAGWNSGGYGNLMVVRHRLGYETWYAHQSRFAVGVGATVSGGVRIGYVGSTGHSTGPHLHFEVRLNGVPTDPAPLLLSQSSLGKLQAPDLAQRMDCPSGAADPIRGGSARETRSPRTAKLAC